MEKKKFLKRILADLNYAASDAELLIAQMNEQQYEYLQSKTAREHIHLKFWHRPADMTTSYLP